MQSAEKMERPREEEPHSVGSVLKEVGISVKDLVQSEGELIKAEIKESSRNVGRHSAQAAIFGSLMALSVIPFLAFLVIGLGRLMNGRYWLSSLLVSLFCGAIGGMMAKRAYTKIKEEDLTLPRTRESAERGKETLSERVEGAKETVRGEAHEIKETTKRRVA